jgi:hypothetical protein
MSYFVVKNCEMRACLYWRLGDKCIKDGMNISKSTKNSSHLHNSETCQIRKQIDVYRLTHMLEGEIS